MVGQCQALGTEIVAKWFGLGVSSAWGDEEMTWLFVPGRLCTCRGRGEYSNFAPIDRRYAMATSSNQKGVLTRVSSLQWWVVWRGSVW